MNTCSVLEQKLGLESILPSELEYWHHPLFEEDAEITIRIEETWRKEYEDVTQD